jgi:hypothetical protein
MRVRLPSSAPSWASRRRHGARGSQADPDEVHPAVEGRGVGERAAKRRLGVGRLRAETDARTAEHPEPGERVQVPERDLAGLIAAHRQAGHRAVIAIGDRAERPVVANGTRSLITTSPNAFMPPGRPATRTVPLAMTSRMSWEAAPSRSSPSLQDRSPDRHPGTSLKPGSAPAIWAAGDSPRPEVAGPPFDPLQGTKRLMAWAAE